MEASPESESALGPELPRPDRAGETEPQVPEHLLAALDEPERDLVNWHYEFADLVFGCYQDSGISERRLLAEIVTGLALAERWPCDTEPDWMPMVVSNRVTKCVERERHVEIAEAVDVSEFWDTVERFRRSRAGNSGWIQARVGDYNKNRKWSDLRRLSDQALTGLYHEVTESYEATEDGQKLSRNVQKVIVDDQRKFFDLYQKRVKHQAALSFRLANQGELPIDLDLLSKNQQVEFLRRTVVSAAEEFLEQQHRVQEAQREKASKKPAAKPKKVVTKKRTSKGVNKTVPPTEQLKSASFGQAFKELRRRRRIRMNAWEPEITSYYIGKIEKTGMVPDQDTLDRLAVFFVQVAQEQGAADPEEDARILWHEREQALPVG